MHDSWIENEASGQRTWLGTDARVLRHVKVIGSGHLAAATRVELARLGIQRDTDCELPSLYPPLVIACADTDEDDSLPVSARRSADEGSPLLLACLTNKGVRIGPLIEPIRNICAAERPYPSPSPGTRLRPVAIAEADEQLRTRLHARLGALLVCAQALNCILRVRRRGVRERIVEVDPWSLESKAYSVIKVQQ
jgi:hypothetical protein